MKSCLATSLFGDGGGNIGRGGGFGFGDTFLSLVKIA